MADNVVLPGTGQTALADEVTDAVLGTGKAQFVKLMSGTLDSTDKTYLNTSGPGFLKTSDEPRQQFYDPFDAALDTTNTWTAPTVGNSAVLASVAGGLMSMGTGTVASGWSKLFSQPTFKPVIPGWLGFSFAIALPDGAALVANSYRFWGAGTPASTPTTAAPLTDAVGFEITTAGAFVAVVYAAGVRTAVATLTWPADTAMHRYIVYVRTDKSFFYVDGLADSNLKASSNFQAPAIQTLPMCLLAVGFSTPPVSNTQIQCSGLAVWDTAKNATQLADGTYPWRKAAISSTGSLSVQGGTQTSSTAGLTAAIGSATGTANTTAICVAAVGTAGNATMTFKGTFSGTFAFECSDDSGTSWYPIQAARSDNLLAATSTGAITTLQMWNVGCPGITHLRVRCSTFVSGTCTVSIFPGGFLYAPSLATNNNNISDYPVGSLQAVPVIATSGVVVAAVATATLAGVASKTTYITGFDINGGGATAASLVTATITGLISSGTLSYVIPVVAGATLGNQILAVNFTKPIPASGTNVAIVVSCPSLGTGNTKNVVNARGYQL